MFPSGGVDFHAAQWRNPDVKSDTERKKNMTKTTERRMERLRELWEKLDVDPTDFSTSAGEDAHALEEGILDQNEELERYLSVTAGGDGGRVINYATKTFPTMDEAKEHGLSNVDDPEYAEHPVRIYDLDSKRSWYPNWKSLKWAPNHKDDEN